MGNCKELLGNIKHNDRQLKNAKIWFSKINLRASKNSKKKIKKQTNIKKRAFSTSKQAILIQKQLNSTQNLSNTL